MHNGLATRKCRWDPEEWSQIQGELMCRCHAAVLRVPGLHLSATSSWILPGGKTVANAK